MYENFLQKNVVARNVMKIALSQIIIGLLFTGISYAEKSNDCLVNIPQNRLS